MSLGASLADARLPDAHLEGANLRAADLQGTYFWYDLRAAYLGSTGLRGARHAGEAHWPPKMRKRYHDLVHPSTADAPHTIVREARHEGQVRYVADGDTLSLNVDGRSRAGLLKVRLIGIDSPDLEHEGGHAARELLRSLLPVGAHVTYEHDVPREDKLRRQLLYVYGPDRRLVNEVMVEQGMATDRLDPPGNDTALRYAPELEAGEAWAREHAIGMWRTCPP
jgi:micrococcal nuclease